MGGAPQDRKPFDATERARIRAQLGDLAARLACPRCDGDLTIGSPLVGGTQGDYWDIGCPGCGRHLIVGWPDVPPERRPQT